MKSAASLDKVLEFCAKVREAGGGTPLEALMPGIPRDSKNCLIARNLNFECFVHIVDQAAGVDRAAMTAITEVNAEHKKEGNEAWFMSVKDKDTRNRIAESLDLVKIDLFCHEESTADPKINFYSVVLPVEIGNAAWNFDEVSLDLGAGRDITEEEKGYAELVTR